MLAVWVNACRPQALLVAQQCPKDELREIVAELIAAYSEPDLQRKIRNVYVTLPSLLPHESTQWTFDLWLIFLCCLALQGKAA